MKKSQTHVHDNQHRNIKHISADSPAADTFDRSILGLETMYGSFTRDRALGQARRRRRHARRRCCRGRAQRLLLLKILLFLVSLLRRRIQPCVTAVRTTAGAILDGARITDSATTGIVATTATGKLEVGAGLVLDETTARRDAASGVAKGELGEILVELDDAVVVE